MTANIMESFFPSNTQDIGIEGLLKLRYISKLKLSNFKIIVAPSYEPHINNKTHPHVKAITQSVLTHNFQFANRSRSQHSKMNI